MTPPGERITRFTQPVGAFAEADLQTAIATLYDLSDQHAYAAFGTPGDDQTGVLLLCGFGERFRTISILHALHMPCLVVQDPQAPWFTGSPICAGLAEIAETMAAEFPAVRRWLLVGQSSGAYGALYLSRLLPDCLAVAFAPQTCDDSVLKHEKIFFPPGFAPSGTALATHPIPDLRALFFAGGQAAAAPACIIAAFSEHANPPTAWLWLDAMHWGRLVDHPDVTVFITDHGSHAVLYQNAGKLAPMIGALAALTSWQPAAVHPLIAAALYGPGS